VAAEAPSRGRLRRCASPGEGARYGVTVNPPARTAVEPPGLVTRTSHTRLRGGPRLFVETVASMLVPSADTEMPVALGAGPVPFSKVTVAPSTKPAPVMVTPMLEPATTDVGLIAVTSRSAGGGGSGSASLSTVTVMAALVVSCA